VQTLNTIRLSLVQHVKSPICSSQQKSSIPEE
jgi:hypothetical protein